MPSSLPRVLTVDALRGASILWVVLFHFWADTCPMPGPEVAAPAVLGALQHGNVANAFVKAATAWVGLPSIRIDLFLLVTGLVLMMGRPQPAGAFVKRRARAVLPNYWLGSLLAAAVLVVLAGLRAWAAGGSLGAEIASGTRLAGAPYRFEPLDLLRSLVILGRFESARTMLVVAPSLWYVVLVMQAYVLFVPLRWLLEKTGRAFFFLVCLIATWGGRALVFEFNPLPAFGPNATVIDFLPFHLAPVALGMVMARSIPRWAERPGRGAALALLAPALLLLLGAIWMSRDANNPGALAGVIGPILPVSIALPALWVSVRAGLAVPGLNRMLAWAGQHSLSILVVQDLLRFTIGTMLTGGIALRAVVWPLMPVYVAASLLFVRAWDPLARRVADRCWPERS